ncbi:FecR family protein [Chitinophaga sp.]|uniref:FecR family protein n=1 Tax=Chitinophaga sp. TaxID=1869181 RepID=UPI002F931857
MIRSKIKALIDKYLDGKATPGEEQLLSHWLDTLAEDTVAANEPDAQSREALRRNILQVIKQRTQQPISLYRVWKRVAAAAAVLLLAGITTWWITGHSSARPVAWLELRTAIGQKKMLLLPDSSRIWLGANGVLRYPDRFTDTRQVQLVSGEAFFDIAPITEKPFIVNTDSLQVRVLGTSFHVRAYPGQLLEIGVSTGKICVNHRDQIRDILTANQSVLINPNGYTFTRQSFAATDTEGWKQDKIVFDNMPVSSALLLLENYYPVKFDIQRPLDKQITGSLNMHLTISQIIKVLEDLTDHQLKIKPAGAGHFTVDQ